MSPTQGNSSECRGPDGPSCEEPPISALSIVQDVSVPDGSHLHTEAMTRPYIWKQLELFYLGTLKSLSLIVVCLFCTYFLLNHVFTSKQFRTSICPQRTTIDLSLSLSPTSPRTGEEVTVKAFQWGHQNKTPQAMKSFDDWGEKD